MFCDNKILYFYLFFYYVLLELSLTKWDHRFLMVHYVCNKVAC